MSVVTGEDYGIGVGFALLTVAIFGLVVLVAVVIPREIHRDRQAHAALDPKQDKLRWQWGTQLLSGVTSRRSIAPASHRAPWRLPAWARTLVAHGQPAEPKGYGPPPPLSVVEQPTVTAWPVRDRNTVPSLLNPAVGAARVPRQDRWEERDVIDDVLRGRMEAAANTEDTGMLPPIRAEVTP
ncbi:hypothetical protein [Plantactinospora sp. WMMB782]|uniref:hypothetical protein n=1 Tax=Plantactinospora sp. WMMB782 TaxID=3404121 RepID=UPI003B950A9F